MSDGPSFKPDLLGSATVTILCRPIREVRVARPRVRRDRLGAHASGGGFDETARRGVTCEDPAPVRSRPRWSRRIPTRIAHGIGHDHAWVFMDSIGNKAVNPKLAESAPNSMHHRLAASRARGAETVSIPAASDALPWFRPQYCGAARPPRPRRYACRRSCSSAAPSSQFFDFEFPRARRPCSIIMLARHGGHRPRVAIAHAFGRRAGKRNRHRRWPHVADQPKPAHRLRKPGARTVRSPRHQSARSQRRGGGRGDIDRPCGDVECHAHPSLCPTRWSREAPRAGYRSRGGGGFGVKINSYGEEYVAAALSKRPRLPIKWIEDRSEAFFATVHGRDLIAYAKLASTWGSKMLPLRTRIIVDIGAYSMLFIAGVPTHSITRAKATYALLAIRPARLPARLRIGRRGHRFDPLPSVG